MTRTRFYFAMLLASVVALEAIVVWPEAMVRLLAIGVVAAIAGAIAAVVYLTRVFRRQPVPRSRFFRMALEAFALLAMLGGWVSYLSLARLSERGAANGEWGWIIPAPPPNISSPISALLVIIVFTSVVRFAIEVWQTRRKANSSVGSLDREE